MRLFFVLVFLMGAAFSGAGSAAPDSDAEWLKQTYLIFSAQPPQQQAELYQRFQARYPVQRWPINDPQESDLALQLLSQGQDLTFRNAVLGQLKRELGDGALNLYAVAADSYASAHQEPLPYGMVGDCHEGRWVVDNLSPQVEANRQELGLPEWLAFAVQMSAACQEQSFVAESNGVMSPAAEAVWQELKQESQRLRTWRELWRDPQTVADTQQFLQLMVDYDQFIRMVPERPSFQVLPASDQAAVQQAFGLFMSADQTHTAYLKALIAQHGWPIISKYGKQANHNAWLLAQHADHDPAFQGEVLNMLKHWVPLKESLGTDLAYLSDRVASAQKQPQRYGTQGRCLGKGLWEPLPLEDPKQVDAWRAEAGLGPLADYQKIVSQYCY